MKEYYTVKEVAEILSVSSMTIYRYVKKGILKGIKLEKDYRIAKIELDRYLKSKGEKKE